jgi:hypothetical protein
LQVLAPHLFYISLYFQLGHVSIPCVYTDHWCCHSSSALCDQTSCWCMPCMTKCHPPYCSLLVSKDTYFWQKLSCFQCNSGTHKMQYTYGNIPDCGKS